MSRTKTEKPETKSNQPPPELKLVKHEFTSPERDELGGRLAQSISQLRGVEAELEQMKSAYKARVSECEARIEKLHTDRLNGFEMREKLCRVEFDISNRKKNFFPIDAPDAAFPALVERLTDADLQTRLPGLGTEPVTVTVLPDDGETRGDFRLWPVVRNSRPLVAATASFAVGDYELDESPDGSPAFGDQRGALTAAVNRVRAWLIEKFDVGTADGFEPQLQAAIDSVKGGAA